MSRLVKDPFGRRYIMRQSGDPFITGVSAERFSGIESALRFIRHLDVPYDFWLHVVHDTGATIRSSGQHDIERHAAQLLHQDRIAFYPCNLPDNFSRPPTFWPGWQQGGFSYSYAPCEVTLLHRYRHPAPTAAGQRHPRRRRHERG